MFLDDAIVLSKIDFDLISSSLKDFIFSIYDYEYIDSVYFTNYDLGYNHGLIGVTLLVNNPSKINVLKSKIEEINFFFKSKLTSGTVVHFSVDYLFNYHSKPIVPMDKLRIEELIESNIIFDKSGYLTNINNQMKGYNHEYKLNIADIEPPVDEEIAFSLYMKKKNDMK